MVAQDGDAPVDTETPKPDRKRLLIVLVVVIVAGALFLYANRPTDAGTEEAAVEYHRIEFPGHGFSVELPGNWEIFEESEEDPQIVMVAGVSGTQNNVRIRVTPLAEPVLIDDSTPESVIAELQAQFDEFIDRGDGVKEVIRRQRIKVNGVHGWQYLYTFTNQPSGQEGIHSHIFLMGGPRMYVFVFQALPTANYGELAGTFDKIISSFQLMEPEASPSPAPAP